MWCLSSISSSLFLSTPSARRATPVRNGFEAISELFLSTPSARRATHRTVNAFMPSTDFYPRPLRGGRRDFTFPKACVMPISIHALCEEGDSFSFSNRPVFSSFLSTPSARRATHPQGRDDPRQKDFYPRPLRGGRLD